MTVVEAPPPHQPPQDELEALIEEARRRTRRRRLLIGGAVVGALCVAGLIVGLVLALRGGTSTAVPRGFHVVRARGPVQHLVLEDLLRPAPTVDLATGARRGLIMLARPYDDMSVPYEMIIVPAGALSDRARDLVGF